MKQNLRHTRLRLHGHACFAPVLRLLLLVILGWSFVAEGKSTDQRKKIADTRPPELVTRVSHSSNIIALEFSFDDSILASASSDGRLILWNAMTGDQLRTLPVRGGIPSQIAFDRSGHQIYLLSQVGIVRYDLASNRSRVVLKGRNYGTFAVSPNGKWLVAEEESGIVLVNLDDSKKHYVLASHGDSLHQVQTVFKFRRDSAKLAIGRSDGSLLFYSLRDSISRSTVRFPNLEIADLAFDPQQGLIVGGCFWDSPEATHCRLRIVNALQRRVVREIEDFRPNGMKFSGDASRLLAFGSSGDVSFLEAFELRAGNGDITLDRRPTEGLTAAGPLGMIAGKQINYPFAVSRDGIWLASAPEPWDRVSLRQIGGSKEFALKAGSIFGVEQLDFVDEGTALATWANNEVDLWNLAQGGLVASWPSIGSFAVSRDGYSLVFFNEQKQIEIVDTRTLHLSNLDLHPQGIVEVVATADSAQSVVWSERGFITTYFESTRTSREAPLELCHYSMTPVHSTGGSGDTVALLCDEGGESSSVVVWNLRTHVRKTVRGGTEILSLSISPDDRFLATLLLNGSISVTELATGRRRWFPKQRGLDYSAVAFQSDGHHLVAGCSDGTLHFWNLQTGEITTRAVHSSQVTTIANYATRLVASGSYDGSIALSHGRTHAVLGRLVSVHPQGWFVTTDDGLFDGTPDALQWAGWRESWRDPPVPLDAFFEDFYTPGILTDIFEGDTPSPMPGLRLAEKLKIPGLRVLLGHGVVSLQHREGGLQLCMRDRPTSDLIENLGLTFQGEPQVLDVNDFSASSRTDCRYYVDLKGDYADYELVSRYEAAARAPIKSKWDDAMIDLANATIHVQTVALGHYPHVPALDLRYSTVDADALEAYFRATPFTSTKTGPRIKIWEGLRDEKATSAAVRSRLETIGKDAHEDDVIVLFLTGHGAIPPGEEMFYFLTSDVTGRTSAEIRAGGLSVLMLADSIGRLRSRRIVVFLDACLSGGTLDSLSRLALAKVRAQEEMDKLEGRVSPPAAVHVFAAATPFENAVELNSIAHGIFAKALLDTLYGSPVTLRGLLPLLRENVDVLSTSLKRKQTPVGFSVGADFSLNSRPFNEEVDPAVRSEECCLARRLAARRTEGGGQCRTIDRN